MRLAINARRLSGRRTGVGRYLVNLLQRWTLWNEAFAETILFTQAPLESGLLELPKNFRVEVIAPRASGFLWENIALKRSARSSDILFCPSYTIPLGFQGKSVVTIHDATQEVFADSFSWWSRIRFAPLYRYSAQSATHILTDSFASRQDLLAAYRRIPPDKISVVHLAPDIQFQPVTEDARRTAITDRLLNGKQPYILFVGKLSVRRNIPLLIEAFARLKKVARIPHKLLLVGLNIAQINMYELARQSGVADSLVHMEYLSDEELVILYSAADIFVFPSSYEGFSLPVLEAMSCGAPVITVNRSALREIVGDAALLVENAEVESLVPAMQRLLSDASLRRSYIQKGFARAREFSWDKAARETFKILQMVAKYPS